jgi:hypothetical protein
MKYKKVASVDSSNKGSSKNIAGCWKEMKVA